MMFALLTDPRGFPVYVAVDDIRSVNIPATGETTTNAGSVLHFKSGGMQAVVENPAQVRDAIAKAGLRH